MVAEVPLFGLLDSAHDFHSGFSVAQRCQPFVKISCLQHFHGKNVRYILRTVKRTFCEAGAFMLSAGGALPFQVLAALLAGGTWGNATNGGSRARNANNSQLNVNANIGCQGQARIRGRSHSGSTARPCPAYRGAQAHHTHAGFGLTQDSDDLLFAESTPFHGCAPMPGTLPFQWISFWGRGHSTLTYHWCREWEWST